MVTESLFLFFPFLYLSTISSTALSFSLPFLPPFSPSNSLGHEQNATRGRNHAASRSRSERVPEAPRRAGRGLDPRPRDAAEAQVPPALSAYNGTPDRCFPGITDYVVTGVTRLASRPRPCCRRRGRREWARDRGIGRGRSSRRTGGGRAWESCGAETPLRVRLQLR